MSMSTLIDTYWPASVVAAALTRDMRGVIAAIAHKSQQSVGEWLGETLRDAAAAALNSKLIRDAELMNLDGRTLSDATLAMILAGDMEDAAQAIDTRPAMDGVPARHRHVLHARLPPEQIAQALRERDGRAWWERLQATGHERAIPRIRPSQVRAVEEMLSTAPHMREATLFVLGQLAFGRRSRGRHLALPPILLVGPPASGKTWWATTLAAALDVHHEYLSMPAMTASFELAGATQSWNSARPGRIVRAFLATTCAAPLFVLDEIDKMNVGNYAPEPVLLNLIERASAVRFRDEFFAIDFDVSRSIFIGTANHPERMDAALRSRFREIYVRSPTRAERTPIVKSIWAGLRRQVGASLPTSLEPRVLEVLVDGYRDARQTQRVIEAGLGRAARRRGPLVLAPGDVGGDAAWLACIPSNRHDRARDLPH